jgi:hypothetical protein
MKIELSWKDDDAICWSEEEARAAWNDGVKYVLWRRDDGQDLRIVVSVPCEFDDLKKAWEDPGIYDGYETSMGWVLKHYPNFPEPEDDEEDE